MGLFGESGAFVGGTAALAFLLAAEVVAATAAVSEAALVYVARHRNLMISGLMIAIQAALTVGIILGMRSLPLARPSSRPIRRPARRSALALALGMASILKSRLLARLLGAPVQGWRWSLVWAARGGLGGRLRRHLAARMAGAQPRRAGASSSPSARWSGIAASPTRTAPCSARARAPEEPEPCRQPRSRRARPSGGNAACR